MFACLHGAVSDLPRIAAAFTPWFEQTAPDTIVFPIDGLQRLYGTPQQIAQSIAQHAGAGVNVAIAETAESAILAARNFAGISVDRQLDHLDISSLPVSEEMLETLDAWGIRDIQQLAQLPETGIAERFGETGVYLQKLAKGAIHRPLRVFQPAVTYDDRIELDHPVELLEPLLFLIARMLNEQCEKLKSHGMSAGEIALRLELDDKTGHSRTLRLPLPMRDSNALLKLLQMDLEAHPPQAATLALSLSLKPVLPRSVQNGIFLPASPAPDKLELTLARIRGIVGENNAGVPELVDTHHPHPYRLVASQPQIAAPVDPANRQAFRHFRPPLQAKVELQQARPARITASGVHSKILTAAGPWRTSGDWWRETAWNRDEWDVMLANGALYRIYREPTKQWFVAGIYD